MANVSYNLLDDYKKISKDFVLTIGNFDGLHTGHRLIIEKTLKMQKSLMLLLVSYHFIINQLLFLFQVM